MKKKNDTYAPDTKWLDTVEAGAYIGRSPRTLEKWRQTKSGPVWRMKGLKAVYAPVDLDAWERLQKKIKKGD